MFGLVDQAVDQRRCDLVGSGRINNDDVNLGIDQFMLHVDVDRSGNVWAVYYDRAATSATS